MRADIYQKYIVKRTDGREEPGAIYFVLRLDRPDNWWDGLCRWTLRHMVRRLQADGDPDKNKFGDNLSAFVDARSFGVQLDSINESEGTNER